MSVLMLSAQHEFNKKRKDKKGKSIHKVSCSDGENDLETMRIIPNCKSVFQASTVVVPRRDLVVQINVCFIFYIIIILFYRPQLIIGLIISEG